MTHKSSSNSDKHPYTRISFWENSANQFWQTDFYSPASKEYFQTWLQNLNQREKKLSNLIQK